MSKEKILVIEDDLDLRELIEYNLKTAGYEILSAEDGEVGLGLALEKNPDLILLDIMLPGMDGLSVCRKIRESEAAKQIPIVMLTAKSEESDVVIGLELGADDYMTKPFSPKELVARIKAVLRRGRVQEDKPKRLNAGPLSIDLDKHEVVVNDSEVKLTLAEFNLLKMLVSKPGRVFTREQLIEGVSGPNTFVVDRNIDVHVRALRKKLDSFRDSIMTIRGVGYKWKE